MNAAVRSPHWHGTLCAETRDEIADRMREVLGDHYFTLVCCNSYSEESRRFSSVEVYPSQWLTAPVRADDGEWNHIGWSTPRLSMGVDSRARTRAEAHEPYQFVYFSFEGDLIEIDHYAPAGYRLRWIFAVERHDRREDRS